MKGLLMLALALWLTSNDAVEGQNRFAKLFKMNAEERRNTPGAARSNQPEVSCIGPEKLDIITEELRASEKARDIAVNELATEREKVEQLKADVIELRKDANLRLEQMSRSSESAQRVSAAQEALSKRISEMQVKTNREVEMLKESLGKRDEELKAAERTHNELTKRHKAEVEEEMTKINEKWKGKIEELELVLKRKIEAADEQCQVSAHQGIDEKLQNENDLLSDERKRTKSLEQDLAVLAGEQRVLQQMYSKLELKYEAKLTETDEEKSAYFRKSLDEEVAKQVDQITTKLQSQIAAVKDERDSYVSEMKQKLDSDHFTLIESKEREMADFKQGMEAKVAQVNEEKLSLANRFDSKTGEIEAKWQKAFQSLRKEHEESVRSAESSAKKALDELRRKTESDTKRVTDSLQQDFESQKQVLNERINTLATAERAHNEAVKDAEFWKRSFNQRSYLNTTHIGSDALDFATKLKVQASEKAAIVRETVLSHYMYSKAYVLKQRDFVHMCTKPYVKMTTVFYQRHLSGHVNSVLVAIRPQYAKHIVPLLNETSVGIVHGREEVTKHVSGAFAEIVYQFRQTCPKLKAAVETAPEKVRINIAHACSEPHRTVEVFLKYTGFLVVLLLRNRLLRLLWLVIRLSLGLAWFFCPFRLLFRRSKKVSVRAETTDGKLSAQ
jgi:myosin heavy subunit